MNKLGHLNWSRVEEQQDGLKGVIPTWKYADMKVLSTTTTMSLLYSWTRSEQSLMSTTFIMGLVGVSIHTSYTQRDRQAVGYANADFKYTPRAKQLLFKNPTSQ